MIRPRNPRLLGLNVGAGVEVKLRLRRAGRDHDFIPYEEVLDTMLHELCHNERGPHDAQFYKLWDELRKVRGLLWLYCCCLHNVGYRWLYILIYWRGMVVLMGTSECISLFCATPSLQDNLYP